MKPCHLLFLFLFIFKFADAQQPPQLYSDLIKKADSLFLIQDFKTAAAAYSAAFQSFGGKGLMDDRYHAASSYAQSGNTDSAFFNLYRMAERAGWNDYKTLTTDSALKALRTDSRWNKLVNKVRQNKAESQAEEWQMESRPNKK